jgi:hypothetical protein
MTLIKLLCALLEGKGMAYTRKGDTVHLLVQAGGRKWSVAITADEQGFLRYYARYPWLVREDRRDHVLETLNEQNARLRAGCFLLSEGYPVFRYGVYIFDALTAAESVADLLVTATAKTAAAWDEIQKAVAG